MRKVSKENPHTFIHMNPFREILDPPQVFLSEMESFSLLYTDIKSMWRYYFLLICLLINLCMFVGVFIFASHRVKVFALKWCSNLYNEDPLIDIIDIGPNGSYTLPPLDVELKIETSLNAISKINKYLFSMMPASKIA